MAKPVTLKVSQFLLLLGAVAGACAGGGMLIQAIFWRLPLEARNLGFLIMIAGQVGFVVLCIWKSLDDWTARTTSKPLGY